ncbi:unnamed protein product [Closterium sp. NIES-54]
MVAARDGRARWGEARSDCWLQPMLLLGAAFAAAGFAGGQPMLLLVLLGAAYADASSAGGSLCPRWLWQAVLDGPGRLWAVLGGYGRFWAILGGSRRFWVISGGSGRSWTVLGGLGRLWAVLDGSGRSWAVWAVLGGYGRFWAAGGALLLVRWGQPMLLYWGQPKLLLVLLAASVAARGAAGCGWGCRHGWGGGLKVRHRERVGRQNWLGWLVKGGAAELGRGGYSG